MDNSDFKKEDLIKLRDCGHIQMEFEQLELQQFWCTQLEGYPQLAKEALKFFLLVATSYLCEISFLPLLYIKPARKIAKMQVMTYVCLFQKRASLYKYYNQQQQSSH
ncbi:hypothetical protein CWI36_0134p0010 [Hamiltosporidium magnivora]|uniref:HAT C-terminal dimerisation domain-containing protein n=1 Tax=Hamiltosporidium magnivora TaxID=148818 RepID=A0A4Q9LMN0_9MICR|nr:hypothetical protein CWI36_0134p0010 [Hamiltosporidium magnivora]